MEMENEVTRAESANPEERLETTTCRSVRLLAAQVERVMASLSHRNQEEADLAATLREYAQRAVLHVAKAQAKAQPSRILEHLHQANGNLNDLARWVRKATQSGALTLDQDQGLLREIMKTQGKVERWAGVLSEPAKGSERGEGQPARK